MKCGYFRAFASCIALYCLLIPRKVTQKVHYLVIPHLDAQA